MDLLIKHEAFAGRGLAVRTAGFFKGPRLIIDGGEVKGKRLRFSLTDNSGHEREIRLKTNGLDPIPRVQIGAQTIELARPLAWHEYLWMARSEEHTSELQSQSNLVCRLLLEKKKKKNKILLLSWNNN